MAKNKTDKSEKEEKDTIKVDKARLWQIIAVVLGLGVVYLFFSNIGGNDQVPPVQQPPQVTPPQKLDIDTDDDPVLGNLNAPVTIVSFEDYQCPFCGRAFQETFPLLKKDYIDTGKAKYVYRDFPLTSIHPEALPAAEAANCGGEQGKYWEFHDLLFLNQVNLGQQLYSAIAENLQLDINKFNDCMESGKYRAEIQNDLSYGASVAGVSGTPTFFINGIKLVGAQPYQAFQQVIEAELAKLSK